MFLKQSSKKECYGANPYTNPIRFFTLGKDNNNNDNDNDNNNNNNNNNNNYKERMKERKVKSPCLKKLHSSSKKTPKAVKTKFKGSLNFNLYVF